MRGLGIAAVALSLVLGCGSRTGLLVDGVDAPAGDAMQDADAPDALFDSSLDTRETAPETAVDTAVDAPLTDVGCHNDLECDDRIPCTRDVCDLAVGLCRNVPDDKACDDGLFCTGDEVCTVGKGCTTTPRACADSVSCTVDTCDEATKSCLHKPDDALCPISHVCDVLIGCQARAIAHSSTQLYEIRLPSGIVKAIGPTGTTLTDIALHPSGTLYGITSDTNLCVVDLKTGSCSSKVALSSAFVALDAAPDGVIYGAGGGSVYTIDRTTGTSKLFGNYPTGIVASGDIAFLGTRLLATGRTSTDDVLVEFDAKTGVSKTLGRTGYRCIWGIAAYGLTLYGLTCEGRVLSLNPSTGVGTELSKVSVEFWGATAR